MNDLIKLPKSGAMIHLSLSIDPETGNNRFVGNSIDPMLADASKLPILSLYASGEADVVHGVLVYISGMIIPGSEDFARANIISGLDGYALDSAVTEGSVTETGACEGTGLES